MTNKDNIELERLNQTNDSNNMSNENGNTMDRHELAYMLNEEKEHTVLFFKVRGPSIHAGHIYAMLMVYFFVFYEIIFIGNYSTFIGKNKYGISNDDIATDLANISAVTQVVTIITQICAGIAFDTVGRKIPAWTFFTCVSLGWLVLNLNWGASSHTLWLGYLLASILTGFGNNIQAIPIVPDIIMEKDQGLAQAITMSLINVSAICSTQIQNALSSKDIHIQNEHTTNSVWVLCVLNLVVMFTVVPNILNVVGSTEHISRGITSQHSTKKSGMLKAALGQAVKVIFNNPMVAISIFGRAVANAASKAVGQNVTEAYEQNYSKYGAGVSGHAEEQWNNYQNIISNILQIVFVCGSGFLLKYANHFNMLILSNALTIVCGLGMIFSVSDIGLSPYFTWFYIWGQTFDYVNSLIGNVIIFNYLELESRGLVLSFAQVALQIWGVIITYMNGQLITVYQSYQLTFMGPYSSAVFLKAQDNIAGTRLILEVAYGIAIVFFIFMVIFRITHRQY